MALFRDLTEAIDQNQLKVNAERIQEAYEFAREAHEGQFRRSGEPYLTHPVATAVLLAEMKVDEDTIIAGLLHDVPEDTHFSVEDVQKRFGTHVADLVEALTKLSKVQYQQSMSDRQVHALRKIFLETAKDLRVVIIKLCDRLHNMTTLQHLNPEKQGRIAKETLEIYVPLASLFGMYQLRQQLEDLCFKYLQPEDYHRIEEFVHQQEKERKIYVERMIRALKRALVDFKGSLEFQGRPKSYYSIYQKCIREQKSLQEIYDYFAIRIITDDVEECYLILGKVHEAFKPRPGRVKDYIALPKPNGYRSIHTTVIGLEGRPTEIQIRTHEMHREAEYGIAAHSSYKQSQNTMISAMVAEVKDFKDASQFVHQLQQDFLQDRIFVFSPAGDTVHLPMGATCLDYMYAVGLPVDHKPFKVYVNQKLYSIVGELQSGDQMQVVYQSGKKSKGPERWWLPHVKTALARTKLREHFKKKSREEKLTLGETLIQKELDHENAGSLYAISASRWAPVLERYQLNNLSELLIQVGEGSLEGSLVYSALFPKLSHIAVPGIFRKLFWKLFKSRPTEEKYRILVRIDAVDRTGLMQEILKPFYKLRLPILHITGRGHDTPAVFRLFPINAVRNEAGQNLPGQYQARTTVDFLVATHGELIRLFDELQKIPGVTSVQRIFKFRLFMFSSLSVLALVYWMSQPLLISHLSTETNWSSFWISVSTYLALIGFLALALWLRSMGNKTFPHFNETRWFWPFTFTIAVLVVVTLFLENFFLDLGFRFLYMLLFSLVIFSIVSISYWSHQKRREKYFSLSPKIRSKADES